MSYLRTRDYDRFIQSDNLLQVLSQDSTIRLLAEAAAQEEVTSYLIQKYNTTQEFQDILTFSPSTTYNAWNRIELNYPAYNSATTYNTLGTGVTSNGNEYLLSTAGATGNFNSSYWTLIGSQYDMYYVPYPYPLFDVYCYYTVGSRVFWKGNIYQCLVPTAQQDHESFLNSERYENIRLPNVFPDDSINGPIYWGTGTSYSFSGYLPNQAPATAWSAGSYSKNEIVTYLPAGQAGNGQQWMSLTNSNTTTPGADIVSWQTIAWALGDNRSQQMVMVMVDVVLFHLHSRIAPKNIPLLRTERYHAAKDWLDGAAHGIITPNLQQYQPRQGARVSFGGNTKLNNTY